MNKIPAILNKKIIDDMKPCMRYEGGNFSEWQSAARGKLYELLGMANINRPGNLNFNIEYKTECEDYTEYRFTIESEIGYGFPSVLRVPRGAVGKIPLMICLQGHSTGFHISLGITKFPGDEELMRGGDRDFCKYALESGFAALAIEQRNFGECGGLQETTGEPNCHVSSMAAIINGRTTIGERVHDVSCAIDAVLENFDFIDGENIMLMGNSGGGTATYYTACLEERIKIAMPSCAVCTYGASIAAMYHCTCNFIPHIARYFDMGDLAGLIAPRKLVVVNGIDDDIFPDAGVRESYAIIEKMYAAAGVPENCALVTGDGGHRFYAAPAYKKLFELEPSLKK